MLNRPPTWATRRLWRRVRRPWGPSLRELEAEAGVEALRDALEHILGDHVRGHWELRLTAGRRWDAVRRPW